MKVWTEDFNLHDEVLKKIPLWVKLPNLPINWWSMTALSKIESALGNPIYADECTIGAIRISFARLLVETNITKPLPRQVKLQDPKGKEMEANATAMQQKKANKGRMIWVRTDKEGGNENKENDQTKESSVNQKTEPEQGKNEMQNKEAGWITVAGKSTARVTKAKQYEGQSVDENNGFQSLMIDQRNEEAGLNKMYKQKEVKEFVRINNKVVIALVEHRVKDLKANEIIKKIAPSWEWVSNARTKQKAIYGLHTIKDRKAMWEKLRQINSNHQGPWLAMGDYNAVLHYVGREYTWINNHTYSRINMGLVNTDWMMIMPSLKIQVLEPLISDHSPLKLMITQMHTKKSRPFRFLNCIADHPLFIQQVEMAWRREGKLERCK
ncbi:uncharacterized protein LOC142165409 [Nicotiana tabacum]|uniref:Uncharacterized protein LOC142165409 n=1 Tax=Nicotiana tabacum TaxID=4097 RepID=A0AC58S512_TOBAC